ncbi:MAG: hypothetical protein J6A89_08490 [Clostridia bacterium]|nr:hypothetical protein [Clostridia bacterium]
MASEPEGFEYICNVNTIFEYMQKEIEFAINNKLELVTEFIIKYKRKKYNVNIWNNTDYSKNESKNDKFFLEQKENYEQIMKIYKK